MSKPYIPFDWQNIGSPLVPFVAIKFRGVSNFYYTFPDKNNRIYIESATFDVFDDSGYSSAQIVLADPDYYNLEAIFSNAIYSANSDMKNQGNWFCACFWGWSYYGKVAGEGQRKTSGIHYYMLRDISYDLSEVDLRVSLSLLDIGAGLFSGDESTKVGLLNPGDGISHGRPSTSGTGEGLTDPGRTSNDFEQRIADDFNSRQPPGSKVAATAEGELDFDITDASPPAEGEDFDDEPLQNIITGKSYWQIIQKICSVHGVNAIPYPEGRFEPPTDGPAPEDAGSVLNAPYGKIVISQDETLTNTIDDLLSKISNRPTDASESSPTWKWDIMAGGKIAPKPEGSRKSDMDVVFGWIPQPSKSSTLIDDSFRLARTFTYKPANKSEIARGETQILSLKYTWETKKALLGMSLPTVYAVMEDGEGNHKIFFSEDDYVNTARHLGGSGWKTTLISKTPGVGQIPLQDVAGELGLKVHINFDTRTAEGNEIEVGTEAIVVNAWNSLLAQVVFLDIEIPGDPWLDNQLFNSSGERENSDILVSVYEAYFKVKVYKMSPGGYSGKNISSLSPLLTGNYLIIKGNGRCSHKISGDNYTTSLGLFKEP